MRRLYVGLLRLLSETVELTRDDGFWNSTSHLALPVLSSPSGRAVRMSPMFKLARSKACQDEASLRKPQQLLASRRQLQDADGVAASSGLTTTPRKVKRKRVAGAEFHQNIMQQYSFVSQLELQDVTIAGVLLDAGRVSGMDLLATAMEDLERGICAWCPPKVP